ncbi:ABC transporter permease [Salinarimonas ramus]|uniref:ABC transporter permease n=1 Tax=Salinarimonas ramus TaxID=690164 RepID=A0A917QGH5_9HYPH|nr:ABC transporter permease [Salinarimonas ramus]GGK48702.1 ABC transporter permease [Salinarimonas ramus]
MAGASASLRRGPSRVLLVAGAFLALTVAAALLAPVIAPFDPLAQSVLARLQGPGATHFLGTDQFGRDLLSRILHGLRASLAISFGAVGLALLVGGTIGLVSAYYRGWTERILMRLMDILFAFPVMLLAIGIIAVLGPGATTTAAAIAIVYTPIFARLLRGPALVVAQSDYVMSARSIGASDARIIVHHILPNLASVVLVQMSLLMSTAILVEASLSFLGLGTQPPTPSLGMMLSEGRNFLLLSPWAALFSGLAILVVAFVLNFFGDVLRDTLDPRLR